MKVKLKMNTYSYFTDGAATMAKENGKYLRKEGVGHLFVLKMVKDYQIKVVDVSSRLIMKWNCMQSMLL